MLRPMPVTRRLATLILGLVVIVAAGAALAAGISNVGEESEAVAGSARCPAVFLLPIRPAAPEPTTFAEAPANSTAIVLCTESGPGELRGEPLAATATSDDARRLVLALKGPMPALQQTAAGSRCAGTPVRILVFVHPGGEQAYVVRHAPGKGCSTMGDGRASIAVPQEVAAFITST